MGGGGGGGGTRGGGGTGGGGGGGGGGLYTEEGLYTEGRGVERGTTHRILRYFLYI